MANCNSDEDAEILSKDDIVVRLEDTIKNQEMKQNHSKIALANLEKSISTYHEKLEFLEGVVTESLLFIVIFVRKSIAGY